MRFETHKTYKGVLKLFSHFLKTRPGIKKLKNIDIVTIEDYISHLAKDHKRSTLNNHLKSLKTMFNIAIDWRYLSDNPCDKIKPVELTDKKPIIWLSDEKYAGFMNVCCDEFPEFYPMFYTFVHTGMRSGELFNLTWEDVDFQRKIICIRQKEGFIPKGKDSNTNQAKVRIMPMHNNLMEMLKSIKKKSDYVFVDNDGNRYSKNKPRRTLIRIAKRAGIKGLSRLHELRHTFASQLVANGVPIYNVKELLGHTDIRDTMKYSHLTPENMREDLKVLERLDVHASCKSILQG
jgi:site-specific recombinase XerD